MIESRTLWHDLSRSRRLEELLKVFEDALRSEDAYVLVDMTHRVLRVYLGKGATDNDIFQLKGSVKVSSVIPSLTETKTEDVTDVPVKPAWARSAFYDLDSTELDMESRIKALGEFQARYLNLPNIVIRYRNVRFTAKFDPSQPDIKTIANENPIGAIATKVAYKLSKRNDPTTRDILRNVSGIIDPGTLTLVIGAPGCGKTVRFSS